MNLGIITAILGALTGQNNVKPYLTPGYNGEPNPAGTGVYGGRQAMGDINAISQANAQNTAAQQGTTQKKNGILAQVLSNPGLWQGLTQLALSQGKMGGYRGQGYNQQMNQINAQKQSAEEARMRDAQEQLRIKLEERRVAAEEARVKQAEDAKKAAMEQAEAQRMATQKAAQAELFQKAVKDTYEDIDSSVDPGLGDADINAGRIAAGTAERYSLDEEQAKNLIDMARQRLLVLKSKPKPLAKPEADTRTSDIKEYEYFIEQGGTGTFDEWQSRNANRKLPKPEKPGLSNMQTQGALGLARQFDNLQEVKDYKVMAQNYESLKAIINSGVGGPGDLALVYQFMKALDPNSVVRETEYATAAKSGNIFAGAYARFNGYLKEQGGFLPQQVKESFLKIIETKKNVSEQLISREYADYARRINNITGEPGTEKYMTNPVEMMKSSTPIETEADEWINKKLKKGAK